MFDSLWSDSLIYGEGQGTRHSAYRSQFVVVEYRWHPLHGEQLRLCQRTGRGGREILYVEVRAGLSRELPAWMADAAVCTTMSLGPPQIGIDALNELRAVLTDHSRDPVDGGLLTSSDTEEARDDKPISKATRAGSQARERIPTGGARTKGVGAGPGRSASGSARQAKQGGNGLAGGE